MPESIKRELPQVRDLKALGNLQNQITNTKESSGQRGFNLSPSYAFEAFLPLTHHLTQETWKADSKDSLTTAAFKAIARGLTYLFTIITAAPLYQAFYGIPKKLIVSEDRSRYAKACLEALDRYNKLRHEIVHKADHETNYLAPHNIPRLQEELQESHAIRIDMTSPQDEAQVKLHLDRLKKEKEEHFDVVIKEQVNLIVDHLKALPVEKRPQALVDVLSPFMNHVGFEDLFFAENERLEFATLIAHSVKEQLIDKEVAELTAQLDKTYNFITLPDKLQKLIQDTSSLFCVPANISTAYVTKVLKTHLLTRFNTLDNFKAHNQSHLENVWATDNASFQFLADDAEKNLNSAIEELDKYYTNLIHQAIFADAEEALDLTDPSLQRVIREEKETLNTLHEIEQQLLLLKAGKTHIGRKKITETPTALAKRHQENQDKYNLLLIEKQKEIDHLNSINHSQHIDFNQKEAQALKQGINTRLEELRSVKELQLNVGAKNVEAFDNFFTLMSQTDINSSALDQTEQLSELVAHLKESKARTETFSQKIARFFGFAPKVPTITLLETVREQVASKTANVTTKKESIRALYERMNDAQKAYFAQEVARQAGEKASVFGLSKAKLTAFGKAYLESYFSKNPQPVNSIAIDPSIIERVVQSESGKNAALYEGWTRFNNWWWKQA